MPTKLDLADVDVVAGIEDFAKVGRIAAAMQAGEHIPPITVVRDRDGRLIVGNGAHRYAAARSIGRTSVLAEVG